MPLVWVTGVSGSGKSAVCEVLKARGERAVDADWEGFNRWVCRESREVVVEPPDPVPAGWLDRYGWEISRERVEALATVSGDGTAFLFGGVENEDEVRDLFDVVVCLVIDDETLKERLATRTSNSFGKHPEELAASLWHNARIEDRYRGLGAVVVDGTLPLDEVVEAVTTARRTRRPWRPARRRPTRPS
ncbi:AAA family ATPase [Lentzea sp. NBRC 102530]|uniref:AAA family ATPase n=1 Tax=Lentzea sp. NBRC 102530 TaxID=3032201 RepID=UPI002557467B|nr:AAA family ATPase [Lentzea sp. NBRC 102530]